MVAAADVERLEIVERCLGCEAVKGEIVKQTHGCLCSIRERLPRTHERARSDQATGYLCSSCSARLRMRGR